MDFVVCLIVATVSSFTMTAQAATPARQPGAWVVLTASPDPVVLDLAEYVTVTCSLRAKDSPASILGYVLSTGRGNSTPVATLRSVSGPGFQALKPTVLHAGYRARAVARGSLLPVNGSSLELLVRPDSCCDVMDWTCDVIFQSAPQEAGLQEVLLRNASLEVGCLTKEFAPK